MATRIETDRLILRPWREAEISHWVALCGDPRVMEFFPSTLEPAEATAQALRFGDRLESDGYGWWVLEAKGGPAFAGVIALQNVPHGTHFTPALEVGWRLTVDVWGRGYATEGARAAIAVAFNDLGRAEVVALTAAINLRSQRVMQRLGMTRDSRDDFDHPRLPVGHVLRPHVLYRLAAFAKP